MSRLSLARIADAAARIDPVFLGAPRLACDALGDALGCQLTLLVDTLNPVRCFKGRGADYFVADQVAAGDRRAVVCASAGNFGQALAYAGRARGLAVTVFAARGANRYKLARIRALGAAVELAGDDFDAAKDAAREFAARTGARFVEDGREVAISEGAGTLGLELLAGGAAYDAVVVPLGNGALLAGIAEVFAAHAPATEVIGVVARGAPAMAAAWRGEPVPRAAVATIADGIAVRVPIAEAVDDLRGHVHDVVEVGEPALVRAMALLAAHVGVIGEPAAVAGLAAILEAPARFAARRVASVICGSNIEPSQELA